MYCFFVRITGHSQRYLAAKFNLYEIFLSMGKMLKMVREWWFLETIAWFRKLGVSPCIRGLQI
jgi:hypothetical protein